MGSKRFLRVIVAGCLIGSATSAWSGSTDIDELQGLAQAYVRAQVSFDQASVRRLTARQFVEISPKGEVDERDAVVGFYAPEKRTAAPPYQIRDQKVRLTGNTAVITQTVSFGVPQHSMSLAQSITATRIDRGWKLTSSQSTPILMRPPGPKQ